MVKRICCLALIAFVLVMSSVSFVQASAYKASGIGTKALARGGGIGAADDYTAIYWNPACLTQVEDNHFAIEPHYLYLLQDDGNSVKNYDAVNYDALQGDTFRRIYASEPAQFNQTSSMYSSISPTTSLGCSFKAKDFTFGLGFYTPAGLSTDWGDSVRDLANNALISVDYFSAIQIIACNFSVAKEVSSYVSLGAGFNYLTTKTKVEAEKTYTSGNPLLDYSFETGEKADGDAVEGTCGILFKPLPNLKIGGVYRSGAEVTLKGDAYYTYTVLGIRENSGYTQDYEFPGSWGIGIAYEPFSKLLLLLEWERTGWHKSKRELDYDLNGGAALTDTYIDWGWEDSDQIRLGAEYRFAPELALRGSFVWDETPLSEDTVSMTNVIDVDKINLYLGLGYEKGDFKFDIGYDYVFGDDEINSVDYEMDIHNFMVGVTYSF